MSDPEARMLGELLHDSHLASLEDVPALVGIHARLAGLSKCEIYAADLQGQFLVPLPGQRDDSGEALPTLRIDATLAGRAFRNVEVASTLAGEPSQSESAEPVSGAGPRRLWVPLLDGTERVGVLGVTASAGDEKVMWSVTRLAALIALLVVSKRRFSDSYSRAVRTRPMDLSAEMLWAVLPSGTFADDRVVVSAAMEPAYEVGGDAYEYAIDGDRLYLSIFDAMGHDISAGLTATIAIGTCRNTRLQGTDLLAASEAIDEEIDRQFTDVRFATGIMAYLHTRSGRLTWVNRGHYPPLILRDGHQVAILDTPPNPPMGFRMGLSEPLARYQLEPGDRLLLYTDGIIEAESPGGERFGLDRFTDFIIRREADGLAAPETLRRLINTILSYQEGRLQDDATVLMVEWHSQRHHQLTL
ncbi:PP2C family protein-serine/threonine phosphatase [Streptosporangium soli]|nr:serine/threonine-protein phosphatase [Streptosporangium sp. KLBMP 9127]